MILVIAEKPSVARTIASFLKCNKKCDGYFEGNKFIITYAFGHLVSLYDVKDYDKERYSGGWKAENFPFIPKDRFRFKVENSKKKQFNIIKSLIEREDVTGIINATDNDREGELISFLILYQSGNKKPVKRILVNEWTPEDIKYGLKNLKNDEEMRNLQAAGYARLITDWLIGINFTSIATLKYGRGKLLNIGRVILPTVKLIYDRDREIENFVPKDFFELEALFNAENGKYTGKLTEFVEDDDDDDKAQGKAGEKSKSRKMKAETRFDTKKEVEDIIEEIKGKDGTIVKTSKKKQKEYPQKLFSLTTLQGYISSKYGYFDADKVLKVCQSLYEGKGRGGYITYPRTDSNYLEDSLKGKAEKTLNVLKEKSPHKDIINFTASKRIFDSSKVDSHSAIIPTYIVPDKLSKDEQIVYEAIRDRFLMAFMPPAQYENTEIHTKVGERLFVTKGKVLVDPGYLVLADKNTQNTLLPKVKKGEDVGVESLDIKEGKTSPPKHYTEETILKAMKNCGKNVGDDDDILPGYSIGTSATRADVLKKILNVGYVVKNKKNYNVTQLGRNLVEIFPVKELFDVDYTGKLEKKLYDIQVGQYNRKDFLNEMCAFVYNNVNMIKNDSYKLISTEDVYSKKFGKGKYAKGKKMPAKKSASKSSKTANS